MKILRLEAIGEDPAGQAARWGLGRQKPWVARVTGVGDGHLRRTLLPYRKDYALANSRGSRGVYYHFELHTGIYEVLEIVSWRRERRYFLAVDEHVAGEVSREEVMETLLEWANHE